MSKSTEQLIQEGVEALCRDECAQAVDHFRQALIRRPQDVALLRHLSRSYRRLGQFLPALETLNRVFERDAETAADWLAAAEMLYEIGEFAQVLVACERCLELEEQSAARFLLGQALFRLGDTDSAFLQFQQVAQATDDLNVWLALATLVPGVAGASPQKIRRIREEFAERLARQCPLADAPLERRKPPDRLRIGYVSEFFHRSNYMKPVWALINHHDRARFEVHLFSDSPPDEDFEGYQTHAADVIHQTGTLDCSELAALITHNQINILVDLNGYSTAERLPLFVSRRAPLTLAWFNMFATAALPGVDAVIGDEEVVHAGEDGDYAERVVRLPVSYLTFEVGHKAPAVVAPPCLTNGYVTFGSLVAQYKITRPVLDAWSEILQNCPGTRLILANRTFASTENRNFVLERFTDRHVDADRIQLLPPAPHFEYLQYYDQIDIALDAFPYNGGTTTMEALWQGVPVLTFDGDRWASRTSQTLLKRSHLAEFVADYLEDYIARAIAWAIDPQSPDRLQQIRNGMRRELTESSACDAARFARSMEEMYVDQWNNRLERGVE